MSAVRSVGIVALVLLVVMPPAAADISSFSPPAMTAVYIRDVGTLLSWAPAPGATSYEVYRTVGDEAPVLVTTTSNVAIFDGATPLGRVVYSVMPLSIVPGVQFSRSECVSMHGEDVSLQVSQCAGTTGPNGS